MQLKIKVNWKLVRGFTSESCKGIWEEWKCRNIINRKKTARLCFQTMCVLVCVLQIKASRSLLNLERELWLYIFICQIKQHKACHVSHLVYSIWMFSSIWCSTQIKTKKQKEMSTTTIWSGLVHVVYAWG